MATGAWTPRASARFVAAYQTVDAAHARRAVGDPDHAAPRADREPAPGRRPDHGRRASTATRPTTGPNRMMEIAESDPKSLILVIADMARSNPPMESSFVAELARRLQGHGPALALPLTWIEQRLAESSLTIEQLVQVGNAAAGGGPGLDQQHHRQPASSSEPWTGAIFVESMSLVEQVLREDPDGFYGRMDFATRDRYRHVVARLAKRSRFTESEVARARHRAGAPGRRDAWRARPSVACRLLPD